MKLVFESDYCGYDEYATKVSVFEFDDGDEADRFWNASFDERCEIMDVFDGVHYSYSIAPGALYHSYSFEVYDGYLVQFDRIAMNV